MNTRVSITRRVGKKFYPIVYNANGSIKPGVVKVKGVETPLAGGNFYVSYYKGKQATRESVGPDATTARNRRDQMAKKLRAIADGPKAGFTVSVAVPQESGSRALETVAQAWLREIAQHRDSKTHAAYKVSMAYFLESCTKATVDEVTRQDMLDFTRDLRDRKLSDRTVANRFTTVAGFLQQAGAKLGLRRHDRPRYVAQVVDVFEQDELDALDAASTPNEAFLWHFALMTGMRDSELMHVSWKDFNESKRIVSVKAHPEFGFKPKAGKERSIPCPPKLMAELVARKSTGLIFPDENGKPNAYLYYVLQDVAKKADVTGAYLHKFRQTYGTRCADRGTPIRTLMSWMGHTSMAATMRYLREASGEREQALSNEVWA